MIEPLVYLNGSYLPRSRATLDIEDRGSLFADGVYEVVLYHHGRPFAMTAHVDRLRRSLREIDLPPLDQHPLLRDIPAVSDELARRNRLPDAKLYWHVSRGAAPRDHRFPPESVPPTVLLIAYPHQPTDPAAPLPVCRTILHDDLRWGRCDIKSLMLLPNVLARNAANARGASEAILRRGDTVTEGTSTSLFIVSRGGLRTHPADHHILPGVTRAVVIDLARDHGIPIREEPFNTADLLAADEAFLTGTTTLISRVTHVDDRPIGPGPSPITQSLHRLLMQRLTRDCG